MWLWLGVVVVVGILLTVTTFTSDTAAVLGTLRGEVHIL